MRAPAIPACLLGAGILITILAWPQLTAAPDEGRLVQVHVTRQIQNPFLPWQHGAPAPIVGYGYFINETQVLTTENLVRNHRLVELLRPKTGDKITAVVEIADHMLNLAILRIADVAQSDGERTIQTAGKLPLGTPLTILQFDGDRNIQNCDAKITQIGVTRLPGAPYSLLSYRLLSGLDVNGEGAPVIHDGTLAGVIMSYQSSTRVAIMLSEPFLSRFITDTREPPYLGPASAGFFWRSLVDPAKRKYLRLGERTGGIQVVAPLRGTPGGKALHPLDVILSWDGHALDNLGFYKDPHFGRLQFSHLIHGTRSPGDLVSLTVFRDGREQAVELRLAGDPDASALVPENVTRKPAQYLVAGGLIMRDLDVNYMRSLGGDWRSRIDSRLLHFYLSSRDRDYDPGDRVVVLVGVLPDRINVDYQQHVNQVIETVNGQAVRNMGDVFRIVDADGNLLRIRLKGGGVDLVFDEHELREANRRIQSQYQIPALRRQQPER